VCHFCACVILAYVILLSVILVSVILVSVILPSDILFIIFLLCAILLIDILLSAIQLSAILLNVIFIRALLPIVIRLNGIALLYHYSFKNTVAVIVCCFCCLPKRWFSTKYPEIKSWKTIFQKVSSILSLNLLQSFINFHFNTPLKVRKELEIRHLTCWHSK